MIFGYDEEEILSRSNLMCGECVCPITECAWMSKGKPVKGWTAKRVVVNMGKRNVTTYHITACPLFIPHPRSIYFDKEGNRV